MDDSILDDEVLTLPNRKMTDAEVWDLRVAALNVIHQKLGISKETCENVNEGEYPVCGECWRLHLACFTDPYCVDHG